MSSGKIERKHQCRTPIMWWPWRFGPGDEFRCNCGIRYRWGLTPGFRNVYEWRQIG